MQKDQQKFRIYELARELDMESKALIDLCKQAGIELRNQLSSVDADVRDQIVALVKRGPQTAAPARSPIPVPDPDRKMRTLAPGRVRTDRPGTPADSVPTPSTTSTPAVPTETPVVSTPENTTTPVPTSATLEEKKPVTITTPDEALQESADETDTEETVDTEPTPAQPEQAPTVKTPLAAPVPVATEKPVEKEPQKPAAVTPAIPVPTAPAPTATTPPTQPQRPGGPQPVRPLGGQRNHGQVRNLNARPQQAGNRPPQTGGDTPPPTTGTPQPTSGQETPAQTPAQPAQPTQQTGGVRPVVPQRPGSNQPVGGGRPVGQGQTGNRPGQGQTGQGQTGNRPGQGQGGQGQTGQQNRPGQGRPGQGRPGQVRPGQQGPGGQQGGRSIGQQQGRQTGGGPGQTQGQQESKGPKKLGNISADMLGGRSSITLEELRRKQREQQGGPQQPVTGQQAASVGGEGAGDETDDEPVGGHKKGAGHKGAGPASNAPGVAGRDQRHKDRQRRRDEGGVAVRAGRVVEQEESGRRRGGHKHKHKEQRKGTEQRKGKVPISLPITVRSLSEASGMRSGEVLLKLMQFGVAGININSILDPELAETIALEKGIELEIKRELDAEERLKILEEQADDPADLLPRAPVVTIMGHVDHGKTTLLDKIRESDIAGGEIGGITQVIRAWRVDHGGRPITFLDTPGHEAFTKMRARGANVTDIAVIVVAVNDGVMPQTEEAIAHARAAGVSIIVALNKVDLPDANIQKTIQELIRNQVIPDDMGGDVQFVQVSGKTGKGIPELLDTISLVAEMKELKSNPKKAARGSCLEAHLDPDEGVFATLLIREGTLKRGDTIVCGGAYGRVRAMYNDLGRSIQEAGPTVPVRITGLDEVPNADDPFAVVEDVTEAREIAEKRKTRTQEAAMSRRPALSLERLGEIKVTEVKVILKAEARGSIEAIRAELEKLQHEEVRVRLLHTGIGGINESDVQLALTSPEDTLILGFNVVADDGAKTLAEERGIQVRLYNIIYQLTDDIRSALEGKLKPREEIVFLGRAVVRETFKISRVGTIAGCYVTKGVIERSAKVRVIRNGVVIYPPADRTTGLDSLKRFKDDVREVKEGNECGIKVAGYDDIKVDDIVEAYRIDQVMRTLS